MTRPALIAAASVLLLAACGSRESGPATPAASTAGTEVLATNRQVMLGLTIPASDVLFQVGSKPPENDAEWDRVVANAVMLAESGAMLLQGPRDLHQPEWTQHANDMIARARTAAEAASRHDVDGVLAAGDSIYEVCEACHNKFMPAKVAEIAAEGAAAK